MALSSSQQALVVKNLGFAAKIATIFNKYNPDIPIDDAKQSANEGLCNAANTYNPLLGASFRSYAYPAIIIELKQLAEDYGICRFCGKKVEKVILVSIDNYFNNEGDCTLQIADNTTKDSPDTPADPRITRIKSLFPLLSPNQQTIIKHHFGIDGASRLSTGQLAKLLNISEYRTRELHQKALNIIKINS